MGTLDQLGFCHPAQVVTENLVGIVQEAKDDMKLAEELSQSSIQGTVPGKKTRQRSRIDGANSICQPRLNRYSGKLRVGQQFHLGSGKLAFESAKNGKREDEIAQGATTDDQDSTVAGCRQVQIARLGPTSRQTNSPAEFRT